MSSELKPCPFCGGPPEIKPYTSKGLILRCTGCGIQFKQKVLRLSVEWLEDKLIENWNKRTTV